ncbi:OmpW/AlkL family protein [Parasphingorhabdus sp.]|uniref:OmpW/AlkL family protein n=1 Tax=Parasphingorhabdus sp. TaxID=2709688 RepID=UPI003A9014C6
MKNALKLAGVAAAMAMSGSAIAGSADGKIQVKVMGTLVAPDGKIKSIELDNIGLPAGTQTKADDNFVPTIAAEYFFTPNISVETICCVTQHDVTGTGPLDGAGLVSDANIIPATLTAKYHLDTGSGFKPYIGAGPTYFIFIDEKAGATAQTLGATRQKMNDKVGFALQAGFDLPVNDKGLGLSVDAKRYFVTTTAHWYAGQTEVLRTRHKIDPWVVSAGLAYRF